MPNTRGDVTALFLCINTKRAHLVKMENIYVHLECVHLVFLFLDNVQHLPSSPHFLLHRKAFFFLKLLQCVHIIFH